MTSFLNAAIPVAILAKVRAALKPITDSAEAKRAAARARAQAANEDRALDNLIGVESLAEWAEASDLTELARQVAMNISALLDAEGSTDLEPLSLTEEQIMEAMPDAANRQRTRAFLAAGLQGGQTLPHLADPMFLLGEYCIRQEKAGRTSLPLGELDNIKAGIAIALEFAQFAAVPRQDGPAISGQSVVPDGWQLVPKEPSLEMLTAWWRQKNTGCQVPGEIGEDYSDYSAYRAMLTAASQPPARRMAEQERAAIVAYIRLRMSPDIEWRTEAAIKALADRIELGDHHVASHD